MDVERVNNEKLVDVVPRNVQWPEYLQTAEIDDVRDYLVKRRQEEQL